MSDIGARDTEFDAALQAVREAIFVARCADDSSRWSDHQVWIKAKHLVVLEKVLRDAK